MSRSFALALSGGGARGVAHIAIFEAFDELGRKPAVIAGSSIGSLFGAAYAAGMSARDIRRFVLTLTHDRSEVFRRLIASRARTFASLLNMGFGSAALVDAEKFCEEFLPEQVPGEFDEADRFPFWSWRRTCIGASRWSFHKARCGRRSPPRLRCRR